jgi:hypothetical protein
MHAPVEYILASMAERGMPEVMSKRNCLYQVFVEL